MNVFVIIILGIVFMGIFVLFSTFLEKKREKLNEALDTIIKEVNSQNKKIIEISEIMEKAFLLPCL